MSGIDVETRNIDCCGCQLKLKKVDLKEHLLKSDQCSKAFQRHFRVSSLIEVLIKVTPCIMCSVSTNVKLKNHLGKSPVCFEGYKNFFSVDDIGSILKRVGNLKRKSINSRAVAKRKLETMKRNNVAAFKTVPQLVSEFRRKTAFTNYRMCVKCGASFGEYSAEEIDETDAVFEDMSEDTFKRRKRMGSYWICKWCVDGSSYVGNFILSYGAHVTHMEDGESRVYFPVTEVTADEGDLVNEADDFVLERDVKSETIFSPCTVQAVNGCRSSHPN